MSEHLDLDALADHLAGDGDDPHLAGCSACTDRLSELRAAEHGVLGALGALPTPVVPVDVVRRIDAALAAEPALQPADAPESPAVTPEDVSASAGAGPPAVPSAAAVPSATNVVPLRRKPRLRGHRAWLPSVAAGVVLLCGAGIGYTVLRGSEGAESADSAAAGLGAESGAPAALVRNDSGLDYSDTAAVKAALPAVLSGQARGLRATAAAGAPSAAAPEGGDPLARLRESSGLASCLIALLPPEDPGVRPLALDYASYAGKPALAVVLPDPDPRKVAIFVVGPQCSATADSTVLFTRLDRP